MAQPVAAAHEQHAERQYAAERHGVVAGAGLQQHERQVAGRDRAREV